MPGRLRKNVICTPNSSPFESRSRPVTYHHSGPKLRVAAVIARKMQRHTAQDRRIDDVSGREARDEDQRKCDEGAAVHFGPPTSRP